MQKQRGRLLALLAGLIILAQTILLYRVTLTDQGHLRARLEELASHAGLAAVALQAVEQNPSEPGEWVRALVHLQSFNQESSSLGNAFGVMTPPGGLYPTGNQPPAERLNLVVTRERLANAELALRQLANQRFIWPADAKRVLEQLVQLPPTLPR